MAKRKLVTVPKQEKLEGEGFARQDACPEVEKAGTRWEELLEAKEKVTTEATEAKAAVGLALETAKLQSYTLDSGGVVRLSTTQKVTISKPKKSDEEE